jgi:hypothetical protein
VLQAGILLIDGDAHDGAVGEGRGVLRSAGRQPVEQRADGRHLGRRGHGFLADPDLALEPCKIKDFHIVTGMNGPLIRIA